jgi:peptidoglycan-associated lipoprotein
MSLKTLAIIAGTGVGLIACSSNRAFGGVATSNANNPYQQDQASLVNNSVYFAFNSASVPANAAKLLTLNASYLIAHPGSRIEIQGNSSEIGTKEYNNNLALTRAQNVKQSLLKLGVPAKQLSVISHGDSKPVFPNTASGHQPKNQRVDLVYTSNAPYEYRLSKLPRINLATMY